MSYWYKATNVREYVVALNSEYNVSIKNEDQMPWEAEDQAYDIIEEVEANRPVVVRHFVLVEHLAKLHVFLFDVFNGLAREF